MLSMEKGREIVKGLIDNVKSPNQCKFTKSNFLPS